MENLIPLIPELLEIAIDLVVILFFALWKAIKFVGQELATIDKERWVGFMFLVMLIGGLAFCLWQLGGFK